MLDIVMIALLLVGFVSVKLLADWCGKETEKNLQPSAESPLI
ncbi:MULTISPECIES: hypothetical protein [unclassified Clostridioides]